LARLQHHVLQLPHRHHTVVLLSNRGDIDLNKFWEQLSELIGSYVKD